MSETVDGGSLQWGMGIDLTEIDKGLNQFIGMLLNAGRAYDSLGEKAGKNTNSIAAAFRDVNQLFRTAAQDVANIEKAIRQADMTPWQRQADSFAEKIHLAQGEVTRLESALKNLEATDEQRLAINQKLLETQAQINRLQQAQGKALDLAQLAESSAQVKTTLAGVDQILTGVYRQITTINQATRESGMSLLEKQAAGYAQRISEAKAALAQLESQAKSLNTTEAQRLQLDQKISDTRRQIDVLEREQGRSLAAATAAHQQAEALKEQADQAKTFEALMKETDHVMGGIEQKVEAINTAIRQSGMADWQKQADAFAQAIAHDREEVARLQAVLREVNLTQEQRAAIEERIAQTEAQIVRLETRGAEAVSLTRMKEEAAAAEAQLRANAAAQKEVQQSAEQMASTVRNTAALAFAALSLSIIDASKHLGELSDQQAAFKYAGEGSDADVGSLDKTARGLRGVDTTLAEKTAVALTRAGLSAKEATQDLVLFAKEARASGEGMDDVQRVTLALNRAFGLQNKDLAETADILNQVAISTDSSIVGLGGGMQNLSATAHTTNQSLRDMAEAVGMLKDAGISEDEGATAVMNALTHLGSQSKETKKALDEIQYSIDNGEGKMKAFPRILVEIREKLKGFSDLEQFDVLSRMFDVRGAKAIMTWLGQTDEKIQETKAKIDDFHGSVDRGAAAMDESFGASLRDLHKDLGDLRDDFGKGMEPSLRAFIELVHKVREALDSLPKPLKDTAAQSVVAATGIAGVVFALGTVGAGVLGAIGFLKVLDAKLVETGGLATTVKAELATLLMGPLGIGLLAGGIANLGINIAAGLTDQNTARQTEEQTKQSEQAKHQAAYNKLLRSRHDADTKMTAEDARQAVQYMRNAGWENYLEPTKKSSKYQDQTSRAQQLKDAELLVRGLEYEEKTAKELADKKAEADKAAAKSAHEREKAEKEAAEARTKLNKEQLKANKQTFREWEDEDKAFEAQLKAKTGAAINANQAMQQADTATAVNLVRSAKSIADSTNTIGSCYNGVHRAFLKAFGNSPFHGMQAWMGAEDLAKDTRFLEIQVQKREGIYKDLAKLPAGSVVVWGKGNSPAGHISVADGQGGEYSDHYAKQMLSHYGGAAPRAFVLKGQEGRFGAVKSAAEQAQINNEIAHYNEMLQKAVAYRDALEKKGLKDTESWNQANSKVESYKDKIANLQGKLSEVSAQAAEQLRKTQEQNFKELTQQVDQLSKSLEQQIVSMIRQLNQVSLSEIHPQGMTDLEKQADNYSNQIEDAQAEVMKLQIKLAQVNVSEEQRVAVTARIKGLNEDINELLATQVETLNQLYDDYQAKLLKGLNDESAQAAVNQMAEGIEKAVAQINLDLDKSLKKLELERTEFEKNAKLINEKNASRLRAPGSDTTGANLPTAPGGSFEGSAVDQAFDEKDARLQQEATHKRELLELEEQRRDKERAFALESQAIDNEKLARIQKIDRAEAEGQLKTFEAGQMRMNAELEALDQKLVLQKQITLELKLQLNAALLAANLNGQDLQKTKAYKDLIKQIEDSQQQEKGFSSSIQGLKTQKVKATKDLFSNTFDQIAHGAGQVIQMVGDLIGEANQRTGDGIKLMAGQAANAFSSVQRILKGDFTALIDGFINQIQAAINTWKFLQDLIHKYNSDLDRQSTNAGQAALQALDNQIASGKRAGQDTTALEIQRARQQASIEQAKAIHEFNLRYANAARIGKDGNLELNPTVAGMQSTADRATLNADFGELQNQFNSRRDQAGNTTADLLQQRQDREAELAKAHYERLAQTRIEIAKQTIDKIDDLETAAAKEQRDNQVQYLTDMLAIIAAGLSPDETAAQLDSLNKAFQAKAASTQKNFRDQTRAVRAQEQADEVAADFDHQQAVLDVRRDGAKKQLAQLQLNKDRRLKEIEAEMAKHEEGTIQWERLQQKWVDAAATADAQIAKSKEDLGKKLKAQLNDLDNQIAQMKLAQPGATQADSVAAAKANLASLFDQEAQEYQDAWDNHGDNYEAYQKLITRIGQKYAGLRQQAQQQADDQETERFRKKTDALKAALQREYEAEAKVHEANLRAAQKEVDALEERNRVLQEGIDLKNEEARLALKAFDASDLTDFAKLKGGDFTTYDEDGKAKTATFDELYRQGLDLISNPTDIPNSTYSQKSAAEAVQAIVDQLTAENENLFGLEVYDPSDPAKNKDAYLKQVQEVAAFQAKAANESLKREKLTTKERDALRTMEREAYQRYQQAVRDQIRNTADAANQAAQDEIALNSAKAASFKSTVAEEQFILNSLKLTYDEKLQAIQDQIDAAILAHDRWKTSVSSLAADLKPIITGIIDTYDNLTKSVKAAYDAASKPIPTQSSSASSSSSSSSSGSSSYQPYTQTPPSEAGKTTLTAATSVGSNTVYIPYVGLVDVNKHAKGTVVPPGFPGDTYPALLTSGEAVLPEPLTKLLQQAASMQLSPEFKRLLQNPGAGLGGHQYIDQSQRHIEFHVHDTHNPAQMRQIFADELRKADYRAARTSHLYFSDLNMN